jgi:hypothetical protein
MRNERELTEAIRNTHSLTNELAGRIEAAAALAAIALKAKPDQFTIEHTITALEGIKHLAFELLNDVGVEAERLGITANAWATDQMAPSLTQAVNPQLETKEH